ncbi:PDR/VanB family oxidoreductase [Mycobacterium sherrisii]|uniref:Oxidoreductase n=1 Tax=Mycobacterium sherrisii TaxID=243061 RepID=A0A1E3STP6_9MYCO|nr:PDR/VanB family oxidoreductase [Mycobacterium sherrisii]MCV7028824.1 oxidoreductase [Mycobacterium sherrisii]MEC4761766.1 PDR/VanB family oxidoreductase [Mycobacterium sherrisii]ODR05540.1 oxidoreductase [Mycobacterium sherrisii]ORW82636.1 oxidoreductase [Mycobacterium sherrisii]
MTVRESLWDSRPADLYGRRDRDRLGSLLWGIRKVFDGFNSVSRWEPSRITAVRRTLSVLVTGRELVAPDVVALTLADPDGGLLPSWTPGGHIDVVLPSGRRRQYSLCGPPGRRTDYRIAIRRIADGGGGSIEMHDAFRVGDRLTFEGPRNAFYLGTAERDVMFVIGGIGVTPILPMMRVAQKRGISWRAVYAGRSREYMPLLDEVVSVAPERVRVWADDEHGRCAAVDDLLSGAGPTTAVYVCGPSGMLEAVRKARSEHADAPLHYERFSPPPVVDGTPFELELARSQRVLQVPANRSALDVMRDHDPSTPYSCQQGFCGTCTVKVLAGQVDHRGRRAVGGDEMLVCVSRAECGRLVIDV